VPFLAVARGRVRRRGALAKGWGGAYLRAMSEAAASLYDTDFFAWTQAQAARLRALPPEARGNGLDAANLAEEIESMGKRDRRAATSLLAQLVVHLLKLAASPLREPRAHWRLEVRDFRRALADVLDDSPSLRPHLREAYPALWRRACGDAADRMEAQGDGAAAARRVRAMAAEPYELDGEVLDPDWFPAEPDAP